MTTVIPWLLHFRIPYILEPGKDYPASSIIWKTFQKPSGPADIISFSSICLSGVFPCALTAVTLASNPIKLTHPIWDNVRRTTHLPELPLPSHHPQQAHQSQPVSPWIEQLRMCLGYSRYDTPAQIVPTFQTTTDYLSQHRLACVYP